MLPGLIYVLMCTFLCVCVCACVVHVGARLILCIYRMYIRLTINKKQLLLHLYWHLTFKVLKTLQPLLHCQFWIENWFSYKRFTRLFFSQPNIHLFAQINNIKGQMAFWWTIYFHHFGAFYRRQQMCYLWMCYLYSNKLYRGWI